MMRNSSLDFVRIDAADVKEDEFKITGGRNRAKGIDMERQPEHLQKIFITYMPFLSLQIEKIYGDQAPNGNAISSSGCCLIHSPKARASSYSSRRTRDDSPSFCSMENLALHGIGVSSGYIMKRRSRGFRARVVLYSRENILLLLKLLCDILQRSGVPTYLAQQLIEMLLHSTSSGRAAIQSMGKIELACYLLIGGLAPITIGGNLLPISRVGGNSTARSMMFRLLSVFRGSGETSAPARTLKCAEFIIDIDPLWLVDSGASTSLTGDWKLLEGIHNADMMGFIAANGQSVWSYYCGRTSGQVNLSGIRYADGCNGNIISGPHLVRLGCRVIFETDECTIWKNDTVVGKALAAPSGLYYLNYLNDTLLGSICHACPHPN